MILVYREVYMVGHTEDEEDDTLTCPYCGETYESGKCLRCVWNDEPTMPVEGPRISDSGYVA